MSMKLLLRDDDVNYFTTVKELRDVYDPIWNRVPVSLAVVPFQTGCKSGAIPPEMRDSDETYPVGENEELVEFLQKKISEGKVSIMLHGYSHEDFEDGWEFEACPNPVERIERGKSHLEDVFDTEIDTFVAPHNSLSRRCAKPVLDADLNILTAFGHWPWERPFSPRNLLNFLRLAKFRLRHGKHRRYPECLHFERHTEIPSYSLVQDVPATSVQKGLSFAAQRGDRACIAYHYWELLKTDLHNELCRIVDEWSNRSGVQFVTDERFFA